MAHSRGRSAADLWRRIEGFDADTLGRLFLEAARKDGRDWRDKEILVMLLERLVDLDPKSASALIAQLEVSQVEMILPELARIDLETAKIAVSNQDLPDRARAYGFLISGLSEKDLAATMALLRDLPDEFLVGALGDLDALGRIVEHGPEAVAQLVDRLPRNSEAGSKFARVAEIWGSKNPEAALAWVSGIGFEAIRSKALASLLGVWVTEDRSRAMEIVDGVRDVSIQRKLFSAMAERMAEHDPAGGIEWARGLEGAQRSYALGFLGSHVADQDPELATRYLAEALEAGPELTLHQSSESIAYSYASSDPISASAWAMSLPPGVAQQKAAEGVTRAWVAQNPTAASEWIATLPAGESRNGSIYYLVEGIARTDPVSAFHWASNVEGNSEKRFYLLKQATDVWGDMAPEDARSAIEKLSIEQAEKDQLIDRMQSRAFLTK